MMHITFRHFQSCLDFARNWFWAVACVSGCFVIHSCALSKTNTLIMRQVCCHQADLKSLSFAFFTDPSNSILTPVGFGWGLCPLGCIHLTLQ